MLRTSLFEVMADLEYSKFERLFFFLALYSFYFILYILWFHNGKVQFTGPISFCMRSSFWIPSW